MTPDPTACDCGHSRRIHYPHYGPSGYLGNCALCPCPEYHAPDNDEVPAA